MSAAAIESHLDAAPIEHGGDLGAARRLFPDAPEPFIDLSTGINPHPYPMPQLPPDLFARLPDPAALDRLAAVAAQAYGAPSAAHVVAAPGTQILLPLVAALVPPGRAAVLGPTYAEHARVAALVGHDVTEVADIAHLKGTDLAIVVNPNNPDGRIVRKAALLALAERCAGGGRPAGGRRGLHGCRARRHEPRRRCRARQHRGAAVVRKVLRARRACGSASRSPAPAIAARLRAGLGPWAVAGPAIAIGAAALPDLAWAATTRVRLAQAARRLDQVLTGAGLEVAGGTSLFRLVRTKAAAELFHHLGRAGILVRRFADQATWLRFGLPASEPDWQRLAAALAAVDGPARPRGAWEDESGRGGEGWLMIGWGGVARFPEWWNAAALHGRGGEFVHLGRVGLNQ